MSNFSLPRFQRLLLNDVLRLARPVLLTALVLLAGTVVIYVSNFKPGQIPLDPPLSTVFFGIFLFSMGLLLTSLIFRDMHHPLERYQYLMLPVSNLERYASRYLLTGPLFVICMLVSFSLMDWIGNQAAEWFNGASAPMFSWTTDSAVALIRVYLAVHVVVFLGAICFRSMNLVRTALAVVGFVFSMAAAGYLATRIFYFDAFTWSSLRPVKPLPMTLLPLFEASWLNWSIAVAFLAWLLYVAYRCLKAHEVQNGL
jgi:hypothetical protein